MNTELDRLVEQKKKTCETEGHRAIVIEREAAAGGKTYAKWCVRCGQIVPSDTVTRLV